MASDLLSIRHGAKHGLLTQAAIAEWCAPIMNDIGILPFFEQSAMVGRDQYNFLGKSDSSEPLMGLSGWAFLQSACGLPKIQLKILNELPK